jgi:hypothetical protein
LSRSPAQPRQPLRGPGSRSHRRGQTLHSAPTDRRLREDFHHDTGSLQVFRARYGPGHRPAFVHRCPSRHDHRCLERTACAPGYPAWAVGRPTCTPEHEGDGHPRGRRAAPKPRVRTKKTLWLWWSGRGEPDLERCWRAYLRRLDSEHTSGWPRPPPGGSRRRCASLSSGPLDWLVVATYPS